MTKEHDLKVITIGSVMGVFGLILLCFSVKFGMSLASTWLMKQGGADTAIYHLIMKSYMNIFLVIGSILFSFGLLLISFPYVRMLNTKNK